MRKVVFGLIGAGHLATSQHLPNLMWTPHARLKTVCDLRAEAVAAAQRQFAVPAGTTDYRHLLADPEIEAVVIATQAAQHPQLCTAALQAGKHVYVEKPLAEDLEGCRQIVAARQGSGKFLAVGFNRRFAPAYRKAKELLDAHGGAFNLYYRIADTYCHTWGRNFPPGVRVFHETCHVFDVLRWLTGSEIASVYVAAARPDDESIVCTFAGGAVATILSSGHSVLSWPKEYLEVIGRQGGLTVDQFVEMWTYGLGEPQRRYRFKGHVPPSKDWTHRYVYEAFGSEGVRMVYAMQPARFAMERGEPVDLPEGPEREVYREFLAQHLTSGGYDVDKGWLHALDHFAECIATGRTPETASAEDGMIAEQVAQACVRSRQLGQPVTLPASGGPDCGRRTS